MLYQKYMLILAVVFLTACSVNVPRDGDFDAVKQIVNERIPQEVYWYQGGEADRQVAEKIEGLLQQPLTTGTAIQIALLKNHDLQYEYENLGIAQADLVQAGLLSNPVLFGSVRFPKGGKGGNNIEFEIAKEFLDVLMRPARKKMAAGEFEKARLRAASAVMDLVLEVQVVCYRLQAKQQLLDIQNVASEAAHTSYQLAGKFDEAGNLSPLELARERSAAAESQADLIRSHAELQTARDDLNSLLGLAGTERDWTFGESLPQLPEHDPIADNLEAVALANRLDLAIALKHTEQIAEALALTSDFRYIGGAGFGISTEREVDGGRVTGPNFTVELPIFDQRQAEIARLESLLQQSRFRHEALTIQIRNEVQAAYNSVRAARQLSEYYRDELVPAHEQVIQYTQQEQNYMLVDVFELLFARRQETLAYRGYIESLADYWEARARLSQALGSGLPSKTETVIDINMDDAASDSAGSSGTTSSHSAHDHTSN